MATFDDLLKKKIAELNNNYYTDKSPYNDNSPLGVMASMSQVDAIKRVWNTSSGKMNIAKWLLFTTTMAALRNERGKIYDPMNIMAPIILPSIVAGPMLVALFGIKPAFVDIMLSEIMKKNYKDEVIEADKKWVSDVNKVADRKEEKSNFITKAINDAKEFLTGKKGVDKTEPYKVTNDYNEESNMIDYIHEKTAQIILSQNVKRINKIKSGGGTNGLVERSSLRMYGYEEKKLNYLYGSIVVIGDKWDDASNCFVDLKEPKLIEDLSNLQYMPFYIKDIRKRSAILLNAYFNADDLSEKFNISYSEIKMLHRINVVNTWVSTKKDYSLRFVLFAIDREDYKIMHNKLQYLRDLAYPICDRLGIVKSPACILKVKLGNFLNDKNDTGLFMFLTGMNFNFRNMAMDELVGKGYNNRHMICEVEMMLTSIDEYPSSFESNWFNDGKKSIGDYSGLDKNSGIVNDFNTRNIA